MFPVRQDSRFSEKKDNIRRRLLKYTRKAFRMLPEIDHPRILDIGCGSGIPTLELARLSGGEITGIDIDRAALAKFAAKNKAAGLSDRVQAIHCSLFNMDFSDECFDIIWSEGSIYPIGFEKGLREWKRFLKPGGYMVIHDEQGNIEAKLTLIPDCGYELLGSFLLDVDIWDKEYFSPLEKLVSESRVKSGNDLEVLRELEEAQSEINAFNNHPERNSSVYFVMRRK